MSESYKSSSEPSDAMQDALQLVQADKPDEAEKIVARAADDVRKRFGAGSPQDAIAQSELGTILLKIGQVDRGIEAFREAVIGPSPADAQAMRDRLTFLMNLGQTLQMAQRFDEAEVVLHKGLEGRLSFYGREHAGYAFGLEPLAEVTFRLGKMDTAIEMMDEVVSNFWRNGHPRVAGAIAIRAHMLKSAAKPAAPFAGLEKLPNETIDEIGKKAVARVARTEDLKVSRQVLADLIPLLSSRLGESHRQTINALVTASNIERKLGKEGDPAIRQSAIRRVADSFDAQNRPHEALKALLGLALAQSDADQDAAAAETYADALKRVEALDDSREKSQVLRNYGLLLADMRSDADAEKRLREAIAEAEKSNDGEMLARALIATGVFVQHRSRPDEARTLLARALPMIESTHPDSPMCRSHLEAIAAGNPCGCGDSNAALEQAFREFVMARLPAGLLNRLDVTLKDGSFSVGVHVNRQPTQEEVQCVSRAMENASMEFRNKVGKPL